MSAWKTNLRDAGILISTFGLAAFASAASAGSGISGSILTSVLGGIFTNLASEVTTPLLERISGNILRKHPAELNHDLQRTLVKAITEALRNTEILYKEQYPDKALHQKGILFLKELRENVQGLLSPGTGITITNDELQQYLNTDEASYGSLLDRLQVSHIRQNADQEFSKFFRAAFPVQLQVCYAELLKDKNNHGAWIAFQKMLMEDTQQAIREVLQRQEKLEKGIDDLQSQKWLEKISRLSPRKTEALREMLRELNQPQQLELKLNHALEEWLDTNKNQLQSIHTVLLDTHQRLKKTQTDVSLIKTKLLRWLAVAMVVIIVLAITAYIVWNQQDSAPFGVNIVVHGKNGETDRVLTNTGALTLIYGQQSETVQLNEKGEAYFKGIPGSFRNEWAAVQLSRLNGLPYALSCDTCKVKLVAGQNINLPVRTIGLDTLKGKVTTGGYAVAGALIEVKSVSSLSDANGNFLLIMPEDQQELRQQMVVTGKGYKIWTRWVNSPDWIDVHLEK